MSYLSDLSDPSKSDPSKSDPSKLPTFLGHDEYICYALRQAWQEDITYEEWGYTLITKEEFNIALGFLDMEFMKGKEAT